MPPIRINLMDRERRDRRGEVEDLRREAVRMVGEAIDAGERVATPLIPAEVLERSAEAAMVMREITSGRGAWRLRDDAHPRVFRVIDGGRGRPVPDVVRAEFSEKLRGLLETQAISECQEAIRGVFADKNEIPQLTELVAVKQALTREFGGPQGPKAQALYLFVVSELFDLPNLYSAMVLDDSIPADVWHQIVGYFPSIAHEIHDMVLNNDLSALRGEAMLKGAPIERLVTDIDHWVAVKERFDADYYEDYRPTMVITKNIGPIVETVRVLALYGNEAAISFLATYAIREIYNLEILAPFITYQNPKACELAQTIDVDDVDSEVWPYLALAGSGEALYAWLSSQDLEVNYRLIYWLAEYGAKSFERAVDQMALLNKPGLGRHVEMMEAMGVRGESVSKGRKKAEARIRQAIEYQLKDVEDKNQVLSILLQIHGRFGDQLLAGRPIATLSLSVMKVVCDRCIKKGSDNTAAIILRWIVDGATRDLEHTRFVLPWLIEVKGHRFVQIALDSILGGLRDRPDAGEFQVRLLIREIERVIHPH